MFAVQRLVYEERQLSLADFCAVLSRDYEGKESLRQMIRNRLPKLGNGDSGVDALAAADLRLGSAVARVDERAELVDREEVRDAVR